MKTNLIIAAICLLLGAALTKYYFPTLRTETKEVEVIRNNIVTEIREVVRQDGTKEIVTVVKDTSTKKSTDTSTVLAAPPKPKWHATVSATRSPSDLFSAATIYGAQLDYNVLGPLSIGIRADTSKQIGLTLGVSF